MYEIKGSRLSTDERPGSCPAFRLNLQAANDDYNCSRKRLVPNKDKAEASRLRRQSLMKKRLVKELFYIEAQDGHS